MAQAIEFPISEFFNQTFSKYELRDVKLNYLCSGSAQCCSCDKNCMKRKTCCIDKLWDKQTDNNLTIYLGKFIEISKLWQEQTCEKVFSDSGKGKFLMISTCKETAIVTDVVKCQDRIEQSFDAFVPVIGPDSILYRNLYCARCNAVTSYRFVELVAKCNYKDKNGTGIFDEFSSCTFAIPRKEKDLPYSQISCLQNYYLTGSKSCRKGNQYYDRCKSHVGFFRNYANYFCYLCDFHGHRRTSSDNTMCKRHTKHGWSSIFNYKGYVSISRPGGVRGTGKGRSSCKSGKKYDFFARKCTRFSCSHGFQVNGTECVKIVEVIGRNFTTENGNTSLDSCLQWRHPRLHFKLFSNSNTSKLMSVLTKTLNKSDETFQMISTLSNDYVTRSKFITTNNYQQLKPLFLNSTSSIWKEVDQVYLTSNRLILTQYFGFDPSRAFSDHRLCAETETFDAKDIKVTADCKILNNNETVPWSNASVWKTFNRRGSKSSYSVCKKFYLHSDCKLHVVRGNYSIDANGTLFVNSSKRFQYNVERYIPVAEGFGVCTLLEPDDNSKQQSITNDWLKIVNNTDYYISIVGCGLSILCLVWIIFTYLYYNELHSLPMFNTVALCCTLLLSDISFIIGVENNNSGVCKTFAIVLHWSLLAVAMWTIIISADILVTFSKVRLYKKGCRARFVKYCFIAYLPPAFIVLVCVLLDELTVADIGYGQNQVCWITNFHARLITFIVPVGVGYVSTVGTLILTIYKLMKDEQENSSNLKASGHQRVNVVKIALKLALVLGVIEGIGFIQIPGLNLTENQLIFNAVTGLLASVLRGLRGLFLWLIYIPKKQVFKLYQKTLQNPKQHKTHVVMDIQSTAC